MYIYLYFYLVISKSNCFILYISIVPSFRVYTNTHVHFALINLWFFFTHELTTSGIISNHIGAMSLRLYCDAILGCIRLRSITYDNDNSFCALKIRKKKVQQKYFKILIQNFNPFLFRMFYSLSNQTHFNDDL